MLKNLEEYYNNKEIEGEIINNNANMKENENHRHKSDNHTNDYVQQDMHDVITIKIIMRMEQDMFIQEKEEIKRHYLHLKT